MKYPAKYFCGSITTVYTEKYIRKSFEHFMENYAVESAITGETGIDGVLLDFNCGLRLQIPEGNWHVRIGDGASGIVFFEGDISAVTLISMEKFYVEWEIALWLDGEPMFYHLFDPRGQTVHFDVTSSTLGDNIAMLPYVEAFRKKFDCEASCSIVETFHDIMKNYYPKIRLTNKLPEDCYACFYFGCWIGMPIAALNNGRALPLELLGTSILPIADISHPPKVIFTPTKPREIPEPYVCIGVQASTTPKCWLAPGGWDEVVEYLKSLGYRVLCIDRDRLCSNNGMTVEMPRGAEDFSGKYTLLDRINQLAYADFFIGVSSGLSWLAWSVDIPVVMISGFTKPWYEFDTPYRINNPLVCHGCFNDLSKEYKKLYGCLSYGGTARAYECSKNISARQVISTIDRLISDLKCGGE